MVIKAYAWLTNFYKYQMELGESDQFKNQLYSTFKGTGLINKLKSTLRKNLLDKLQIQPKGQTQKNQKLPFVLTKKVIACIISQYLLKNNQEYTVSILLPESNLDKSELLNNQEIYKLLGIQEWQYQGIENIKHNHSVLEAMIYMCSCEFKKSVQDVCIGTDGDFQEPLIKKLQKIQQGYLKKMQYERLQRAQTLEQILDKQKYNITQMLSAKFNDEKRMLTNQIQSKIRREEGERWGKLSLMAKKQQDLQYQKKLRDLKQRQKDVLQRLQKRRKQVETQIGNLRNKELDMIKKYQLRTKELDVQFRQRTRDIESKQKQLHKQELQLRAKKKQYQDCIKMVRQKIIQ